MKYLSKLLSMLLVGAMLYSTGCTDYDTDIKNLENKVDKIEQELKSDYDGKINTLSGNLSDTKAELEALIESEIAKLTAEHDADIKALEDAYLAADSALEASLQAKIDAANKAIADLTQALAEKEAALKAAYEAGDAALAKLIEEAKAEAAGKAEELNNKILALESALAEKEAALEAAIKAGDDALQASLDAEVATLETQLANLTAQMNNLSEELTSKITDAEAALLAKIQELENELNGEIGKLRDDMQSKIDAANEAISEAQGDIEGLDIRVGQTETDIEAINGEIKALQEMIAVAKSELEATIAAGDKALADSLAQAKADLAKAIADGDATLAKQLEEQVANLQAAIAEGDQALAQQLADAKAELAKAIADGDAALAASLQQAIATLEGQIDELEKATDAKIAALQAQIEALEKQLNGKIAELQAQDQLFAQQLEAVANDLAALSAVCEARYNQLVASISALETKLQAQIDQNKRDIAQNAANIVELSNDLTATQNALTDLTNSVANLEILLYKHYDEFVSFQALIEGEIAALKASMVLLQASYNEIVNEIIPGLEQQIAQNEELIQNTIADLAKDEAIFNAYREATNNTLDLLMKTDAALQTILTSVCDDVDYLKGELATLTSAIADAQAACQEQLANCYAYINEVAADFGSKYNSLASMQAAQQAQMEMMLARMTAYEAYFTSANNALQAEINERKSEDRRISVALTELATKYDDLDTKYDARCTELATSIASLAADFAEYKVQVQHTIDALLIVLRQEIAAALNSANQYTDQEIAMLDAKLTDKLDKAVIDLKTRISNVESELKALVEKTAQQLRQEMNEIKYDLNEHIQNILASLEEVYGRLDGAEDRLDGAENRLDGAESRLDVAEQKIQENFEFFLGEVNSIRDEITNINTRIDNVNNSLNILRAEFESYRMQMENELADLKTAYTELINNEIASLREEVKEIIKEIVNRVQSIVFVPKYTDGKGTIGYAKAGETIVETRSQAEYQVYPASCAEAIASSFDAENPSLRFDCEYLETRSAAPSFKVVAVEKVPNKDGRILVTFEPRGLDHDFYARQTEKEYALSLVLTTDKVNLSSDYTSFVSIKKDKAEQITMDLMYGDEVIKGCVNLNPGNKAYMFEYTDTETVFEVLPEHYVAFTVSGKTYNSIEALNAAGYALNLKRDNYTDRAQKDLGTRPFVVNENEEGILEVKVDEVNGKLIYNPLYVGYTYTAGDLKAEAYSNFTTVPVQAEIKFQPVQTKWTYVLDAPVDAANNGEYYRNDLDLTLESQNLPSDVKSVADVIANAPQSVKVLLDGEEVDVVASFFVDGEGIALSLKNFAWNKTYVVEAMYSIAGDSVEVTVTVPVTTIDRSREVIKLQLEDAQWMLIKAFQYESETAAESLEAIYETIKATADLGEMTAEDFLKDIFVTRAFDSKNSVNGESNEADDIRTKLVIVNDGLDIKSVYNVNEYAQIPEKLEYFYHITTWYGQEIEISKTLNIGLKPVEITLDADPVMIETNLKFSIDNQSLAEIFNQVNGVSVKMGEFTADEYLKAIFRDFETRAKSYSANGIESARTLLSVDPANPSYAVTSYDYEDFNEAVMYVDYKTTYTTWYGQEIIINQRVDFAFPGFDFKHNFNYVYGANMDFYSQVQPLYTWYDYLDENKGLLKFDVAAVDLRAAFSVVDAEGNMLTADELAELGLAYNFVIENKSHDGISIDPATDKLSYYGANPTVDVRGNLYIVNDNNTAYTVPTSFDKGGKYATYNVVKFNPIGTARPITHPTVDVKNATKYSVRVLDYVELKDYRSNGRPSYDLIANGAWVVGNGKDNGFAEGVQVGADYMYRITETWAWDPTGVENKDILPYITFDNGVLTFDNTQQLELTAPFTVPVTLKFQNCWMETPQQVTINVTFNPINNPIK